MEEQKTGVNEGRREFVIQTMALKNKVLELHQQHKELLDAAAAELLVNTDGGTATPSVLLVRLVDRLERNAIALLAPKE